MKSYSMKMGEIKTFGIPNFERTGKISRLPDDVIEKIPSLNFLGRRVPGARIGFKTNSKKFKVRIELETLSVDIGMSIYACQSAFVFLGERVNSKFLGIVNPSSYEAKEFEKVFEKSSELEQITVFLPRNEIIKDVFVEIDDGADFLPPDEYKYSKPALFYGSSITEMGICSNPGASYNAIISRHLDLDYYNFGFSGNCKGELEMADYINTLDVSILIYDYDHNAPNAAHLEKTHEGFFKRIREKRPDLPVVMMTRPFAHYGQDEKKRREIIKTTYENAIKSGDKNVYFIDGEDFFKDFPDPDLCFIDTVHPTDLGFYLMAKRVEPVIKSILEK